MTTTNGDDIRNFMTSTDFPEFKPFAYFDKHLDCIIVKFADCSMLDIRLNRLITISKSNRDGSTVGFTIKGVAHLFEKIGLEKSAPIALAKLIHEIVKHFPDESSIKLKETFEGFDDGTGVHDLVISTAS